MTVPVTETVTAQLILDAARTRLLADGYAGLSTRKVAQEAGVPLSQVHYHFGSKGGMVLALLEAENQRRARPPDRDVRRGRRRCGGATSRRATSSRTTSSRATSASSRR